MDVYFRGILSSLRYAKDYAIAAGAYVLASKTHRAMPTLTAMDAVTDLSPLVVRVLGQNPGPFTLQGTNTYLVGKGNKRALVDTGEPNIEKYLSELKSVLTRHNAEIDSIIITHWHHDHVGGINSVIKHVIGHEVPIYKIYREGDGNLCKFEYIVDGHEIRIEGATIRFIQTPGHTSDHTSLWLEEENALFSGDCILGEGTAVFEDLHTYMKSLYKIKDLNPTRIYPGHGPVIENCAKKVDEYISHRMKREIEILDVLRDLGIASSMDITNKVYADTPMSVRIAALNNVELHLTKLIKDEKVEEIGFHLYKIAD